jgi:hypothetical protein
MFVLNPFKIPLYQPVLINLNYLNGASNMGNRNLKDTLFSIYKIKFLECFSFKKIFWLLLIYNDQNRKNFIQYWWSETSRYREYYCAIWSQSWHRWQEWYWENNLI